MKKLFTLLFALCTVVGFAQNYTAGNVVVLRIGDGSALGTGTAPVSLLEFAPATANQTTPTKQINFGSTTAGSRLTLTGTTSYEGQLNLSQNGNYLCLVGYDAPAGDAATNTGLSTIPVGAGGSGYTSTPTLNISAPDIVGGIQATGGTQLTNGSGPVTNIYVTNSGSGYTATPTITITGGGPGSGATAGAVSRVPYWQGQNLGCKKVIIRVDNTGAFDYSTIFNATATGTAKSAVSVDGSVFWSLINRVVYNTYGSTSQPINIANVTSQRLLNMVQSKLYVQSSSPTSNISPILPTSPLPTTSTGVSIGTIIPMSASLSPLGFVFFDMDGSLSWNGTGFDLLYICNVNSGLEKYYWNGSAWVPVNSQHLPTPTALNNTYNIGSAPFGFSSITGTLSNSGKPILHVVRGNGSSETANSLYTITDNSNRTTAISAINVTKLADAGTGYVFKSVAFSPGTTSNVVLSAELTTFTAKPTQKTTLLAWTTATEKNNATFNIEQSTNGTDFQTVGQVKGHGTTARATDYNFEHKDPSVGINYYRLKQVDIDGAATYSAVRSVLFGKGGLVIKTTLVHDALDIIVSDDAVTSLGIFNISGQQVLTLKAQGTQRIDVSTLPIGLYIIRTATGDVGRFVKQ